MAKWRGRVGVGARGKATHRRSARVSPEVTPGLPVPILIAQFEIIRRRRHEILEAVLTCRDSLIADMRAVGERARAGTEAFRASMQPHRSPRGGLETVARGQGAGHLDGGEPLSPGDPHALCAEGRACETIEAGQAGGEGETKA